jgi:hypothetical protein
MNTAKLPPATGLGAVTNLSYTSSVAFLIQYATSKSSLDQAIFAFKFSLSHFSLKDAGRVTIAGAVE